MAGGAPAISRERRAAAELDERQQSWRHKACDLFAARARPGVKPRWLEGQPAWPAEHAICERYPSVGILYVPLLRGTPRRVLAVVERLLYLNIVHVLSWCVYCTSAVLRPT